MRFWEIARHQRGEHTAETKAIRSAEEKLNTVALKVVAPSGLVMLTVMLYGIFVGGWLSAPWWRLAVLLYIDGMFALLLAGWGLGMRATRTERRAIGRGPWTCEVCDATLPRERLPAHRSAEHPEEASYFRLSRIVVLGFFLGFLSALLGLLHVFLLDVVDGELFETSFLAILGGGVAAMSAMIGWGAFGHPRRIRRAREAWRSRGDRTKGP